MKVTEKITLLLLLFVVNTSIAQQTQSVMVPTEKKGAIETIYNQGIDLYNSGDKEGALAKFDACIAKSRNVAEPFLAKGFILLERKQYEEALVYLELYKDKVGKTPVVQECIADANVGLRKIPDAIVAMDDVVAAAPNDGRVLEKRANLYIKTCRYSEAIADFDKVLAADPKNVNALKGQAELKKLTGDFEGSVKGYDQLIALDPNNALHYSGRGVAKLKLEDEEGAMGDFNKALSIDKDCLPAYNNRAILYLAKEEYELAEVDLQQVLKSNPKHVLALNNLGIVYFKTGRIEESIPYYDKAVQYKEDYGYAYFNRGISKRVLEGKDAAMDDWNKALSLGVIEAARYMQTRFN